MFELSVIVPVYNDSKHISVCLESLLNQSGVNIKIIIVNDCSTDDTYKIVTNYANENSNIQVINMPTNSGPGLARNTGIKYVDTPYIAFIDSDDWVDLNFYKNLLDEMRKYNCEIAIAGISDEYNNSMSSSFRYCYDDFSTIDGNTALKLMTKSHNLGLFITPIMNNKVYKTEFIVQNNIYCSDNKSWQDDFFSFFAILYAKKICLVPKVQYHYCQNNMSITHNLNNAKFKIDNCIDVLIKIRERLYAERLYNTYEIEYNSFVERCISSLLAMLKREPLSSQTDNLIYLFEQIIKNFDSKKIIQYLDNERIYNFFNL